MVRSILLGVDGSPYSDNALTLGLHWAARFDALLVGLGIIDESAICQPEMVPIGGNSYKQHREEVCLARARTQVEGFLEQVALRCAQAKVACKLLEEVGPPAETIMLAAQRYDLILLGQQTFFRFATQEGPDDTLAKVLKNTPRPVVTVPKEPAAGNTILVAYDGSVQAARALQAFQTSGLAQTGECHVLCVGADHVEAARHADRAVEFLAGHGTSASRHVLDPAPSIAEVILNQARALSTGLLVMGCYGQPILREFFLGSVTRTVLARSDVPLMLFH